MRVKLSSLVEQNLTTYGNYSISFLRKTLINFLIHSKADIPVIQKIFPNAQFKYLEAGHWVHAEKPEEFTNLVVEFLNK